MKILIVKPSSLGDVIQALPVLRLLKRAHPAAVVHWWLADGLHEMVADDPDVDRLISFNRRDWKTPGGLLRLAGIIRAVRAEHYDLVIDLQGLARSGLLSWLARGDELIGIDLGREGARMFYDVAVSRPREPHAVDWYLAVARRLGLAVDQDFDWLPTNAAVRDRLLADHPLAERRLVGIVPGARWKNKRWPVRHFGATMDRLGADGRTTFLIIGGEGDREFAGELANRADALNLLGQTSLVEMIEWIRRCSLVVTNDTGPMHVAAAMRKPVVALFGPTSGEQTGPYAQAENSLRIPLPCAPCMKGHCRFEREMACLDELPPAMVVERAESLGSVG